MMKLLPCVLAVAALAAASPATAQDEITNKGAGLLAETGRFGLGLGGSTLTSGVTGKLYLSGAFAAQATVGWWGGAGLSGGVDIIVERAFVKEPDFSIQGYLGGGVALGLFSVGNNATVAGVAGVGGVGLHLDAIPIELTAELRPTLVVGNSVFSRFYFGGGGAVRYYF